MGRTRRSSADPDVDAVYIPLPNHLHAEWTIRAAEAGKHVLCEKPLALTAAEAERMIEAADRAGVVLMEAFMYRHHPTWVAARELVADGRIGQLLAVQSFFGYYNDDPANIRNIADIGGGALYDIGCYCVNLSRMLFGAEPTRVSGSSAPRPGDGDRHPDRRHPRVRRWPGRLHVLDARRGRPARRHLRHRRAESRSRSRSTSRPIDPTRISLAAGGDPPVAPALEVLTFPVD